MIRDRLDRKDYPDAVKLAIARRLRREATPSERHAWSLLRRHGILGLKFRRQHVLHGFIVDFYCPRLRLILELDGVPHDDETRVSYDAARTTFFEARGYRVMRLRNQEVDRKRLKELLRSLVARPWSPSPEREGGQGERYRPVSPPSPDRERGSGGEVPLGECPLSREGEGDWGRGTGQ